MATFWCSVLAATTAMAGLGSAQSFQYITNSSFPGVTLTNGCLSALMSNISCDPWVSRFRPGQYYDPKGLEAVCTAGCQSAIQAYTAGVEKACSGSTYNYTSTTYLPVAAVGSLLLEHYQLACLQDSGHFCNYLAYEKSLQIDPNAQTLLGPFTSNTTISDCDLCFAKQLQIQAESPFDGGPDAAAVYASFTSSCHITGMPLTTISLASSTTSAPTATASCSGSSYQVKSGDTCRSIAKSQGISVGWLVADNPTQLKAYCANFTSNSGQLCIQDKCNTYTVQENDTCTSIARANNVTDTQIITWNPVLNPVCSNIGLSVNDTICIGKPGMAFAAVTVAPPVATSFATAAPVPTDVAANTTHNCGEYYLVQPNDYCNLLCVKFGLTLDDFIFLNPALNQNCTNLYAQESYCVAPVGSLGGYPGHSGYIAPTSTVAPSAYNAFPTATFNFPELNISAPLPLANGSRTDCYIYTDGSDLQHDIAGTFYSSTCELYITAYDISAEMLQNWNPSLNTNSSGCSFDSTVRYCMSAYNVSAVTPSQPESEPDYPLRGGSLTNCSDYTAILAPDTCASILTDYNITYAMFAAWNPAVEPDCQNLYLDYSYCIRLDPYVYTDSGDNTTSVVSNTITASPTSGSVSSTAVPTTPPAPTQDGQPADCVAWYVAQSGDNCDTVEKKYQISEATFHAWNPAVSSDCTSGFWAEEAYCVGVSSNDPALSSTTTRSTVASTTTSASPAPSPTQPNSIASNCNAYAAAPSGSYCSLFADTNHISTANLYAWNTVLGANGINCGTSFFAGYYYCISVSS